MAARDREGGACTRPRHRAHWPRSLGNGDDIVGILSRASTAKSRSTEPRLMSRKSLRNRLASGAAVLLFLHSANGAAQGRGQAPAQLEPVKCWWQTDKG